MALQAIITLLFLLQIFRYSKYLNISFDAAVILQLSLYEVSINIVFTIIYYKEDLTIKNVLISVIGFFLGNTLLWFLCKLIL